MTAVLGLDLGTTEARAVLISLDGSILGLGACGYPTARDGDGRAEQDPADWWGALDAAIRGALAAAGAGAAASVTAIAATGQGPTLAPLDASGAAVRPAITWQDRRPGGGGFGLLPTMAWLAREDPAALGRARWLLSAWDAVAFHLTGVAVTSIQRHERPVDAAGARAAGIDPALIPPPIPVGAPVGGLTSAAAVRLGLPAGIPVVAGVNDGTASMLGAGLLEPGDAVDTGGASGGFGVYVGSPLEVPGTFSAPAPIEGRWVLGGAMAATGAALDWLAGPVLGGVPVPALIDEAAAVPPGAEGLVFLPYLSGERAPIFDEAARGVFAGLTLGHGRGHLVRAVLEGAAHAIRHVADPILAAGATVGEMRLAGGPSRSELWARIKADVTGFPVGILAFDETAVAGAAILAAAGAGLVDTPEAAIRSLVRVARRIEPDPATRATYEAAHRAYRALHPAVRSAGFPLVDSAAGLRGRV